MKRQLMMLSLLLAIAMTAHAQKEIDHAFFDHMRKGALILSSEGMLRGDEKVSEYVAGFIQKNGAIKAYTKEFDISVNAQLDYEIGELKTETGSFKVMFLKRKDDPSGAKIEFLVLYPNEGPEEELNLIKAQREAWMIHCNAHQADKLVKEVYTPDAYYYNRGRLLEGTAAISAEYAYMNSANYSLKLTPKHLTFVTPNIAYEIGRCSGSYPLPYMLLWEKQADGNWQVLMDSNY